MNLIKKVDYNTDYRGGCETCDYGSEYIDIFDVEFNDGDKLHIEVNEMYEHNGISEADLMRISINSKNKEEFKKKIINTVKTNAKAEVILTINNEEFTFWGGQV